MIAVIGVRRVMLVTIAILLPVILGVIVVLAVKEDRHHTQVSNALHRLAHASADGIDRELEQSISSWFLSTYPAVNGSLRGDDASDVTPPDMERLAASFTDSAMAHLRTREGWVSASLHDLAGARLAAVGPAQSIAPVLQQTITAWQSHLMNGVPRLAGLGHAVPGAGAAYLIPLRHEGRTVAVVAVQYDYSRLGQMLARPLEDEPGQRLLIDRTGRVVASAWTPSSAGDAPVHPVTVDHQAPTLLLEKLTWDVFGTAEGVYPDGRCFILATSPIRNSEWLAVVSRPCQSVFGQFLREPGSLYAIMACSLLAAGLIGGILVFAVVGRNTAEQRLRVLEAEQAADRRLAELAANFPGVVFRRVLGPDGELTYPLITGQDQLLLSLIGGAIADGKPAFAELGRIIQPDRNASGGLAAWEERLQRSAQTLEPVTSDFSVLDDLGRRHHYRTQSSTWRDADGSVVWDGVVLDTTDVQEADQARRAGEQRLAVALDAAKAGLWDWDLTNGKCVWTENMWRLFGHDSLDTEPNLGLISDLVHAEDRDRLHADMVAAISCCGSLDVEFRVIDHGEVRWLQASARCFGSGSDDGRTDRMTGILLDVTERKRIASQLQDAKDEADRANVAKSKFLAAASHDLRQPVQSLLFFAHVLGERLAQDPAHGLVISIQRALDALKSLLDGVLDLSKLDAGVVKPEHEVFPINSLLERIGSGYAPRYAAKGLVLRVLPSEGMVDSDPILLGRILGNLVENALTYTVRGGVLVGCRRRGDQLRIEVWDSGIGIPQERQQEIFEEFVQIRAGNSDDQQGLGLGLAIVTRLASLLGHEVTLRSIPDRGSCFAVTVPLIVAETVAPPVHPHPSPAACDGLVLVINDEAAAFDALHLLLSDWGYAVITATSATDALASVLSSGRQPDLVISDTRLIQSDGGVLIIQRLRDELGTALPGVILTGNTDPALRALAETQGLAVLHKPVMPDSLRQLLQDRQKHTGHPSLTS